MANIKDIAKAAGVSAATVSNVINGKANVGPQTREKILRLCEEMNYHPNILARNLKKGKTNTIMFVFSDFQRSFYLRVINGINDCLLENQISMIVCTHTGTQHFMRNGFVDGAIVLDKSVRDQQLLDAAVGGMPIVVMDRILSSPLISSVVTDNRTSMTDLTRALVEKGYRKFHYIGGVTHTLDHIERYEAFRAVLDAHGIPFDTAQAFQGDYSVQSGARAAGLMIAGGNLPEAVVCANDNMAAGVVQAFQEADVMVPKRVAVSGFDGDPVNLFPQGFLTTAVIPRYEMGYLAAQTLLGMIRRQDAPTVRKIKAPIFMGDSA